MDYQQKRFYNSYMELRNPGIFDSLKGIIFDLDDTLIDSLEVYTEALNQGTSGFNLKPVKKQEIACLLDSGKRLNEILAVLFPETLSERSQQLICQEKIRNWYLEKGIAKVELKPGVRRILHSLKGQGFKVGIVTGRMTQGENKWTELKQLGISVFIDSMVTAAEAAPKPAPDGLNKCVRELGLLPGECIFIGDSRVDVLAGKNAGIKTIAVHNGISEKDSLSELKPDYILADLGVILPYFTGPYKNENS